MEVTTMILKIKCYVKQVKTSKSSFYSRYTFVNVLNTSKNEREDVLFSVKFTKDVPEDVIPKVSSVLICDAINVSINHSKDQVWITGVKDVIPMERPVTDLSQYFEVVDDSKEE